MGGALAVVLAAPFLLYGLGGAPFDDPGEGMHAEIARELRLSGDPLDLRLNGVPYLDKPALLYVLLAGAFTVGGEREAAARAVPAVAALTAVAATAWLGGRLLGLGGGVLAGGALLTCPGFFAYGRYVRPETLLLAALAGGFACTLIGIVDARRGLIAMGLGAFGVAGLVKDPLATVAPAAVMALAMTLSGRLRPVSRWLPWSGVLAGLLLAFGWWAAVAARVPGFAWYAVIDNHLLNVLRVRHFPDEDVPLAAGQFLAVAALGAAPWVLAAAVSVIDLVRRRAWREPDEMPWVALTVWAVSVLALTTLSPFRLPHYGLPAYPALALLAARAWRGAGRGLGLAHVLGFAALAGAALVAWAGDAGAFSARVMSVTDVATRKAELAGEPMALLPWETIRRLLGATGVILGAGAISLVLVGRRVGARVGVAAVVLITMLALQPCVASALAAVSAHRAVRGLALEIARAAGPQDLVAHEGPLENSGALEWYSHRRPVIVDGRRSVLGFGSTVDGAAFFWDAARLRRAWESGQRVWLVTTRARGHSVAGQLPGARLVMVAGGRRLYVNR
jgi:4-amino-4-deoxy-L-arabinose transferase-like glycosyltransferase